MDISIALKNNVCTGCGVCFNICTHDAIKMIKNDEGFFYPRIDYNLCVQCGLCAQKCHALNINYRNKISESCYAIWTDDESHMRSSSAGVFYIIAKYAIENNGYVCGAVFSHDFTSAYHTIATTLDQVEAMRKSKYIQSETHHIFLQIKKILQSTKNPIIFSGTPCQIAALYSFLGKDYQNLYTLDLICHCVPSPLALKYYIKDVVGDKNITRLDFRPKQEKGWGTWVYFEFDDGSSFIDDNMSKQWYTGFLNQYTTRICCQTCAYANIHRVGNITLGDFWGIHHKNPQWSSKKGTSLVIINNNKGKELFQILKNKFSLCEEIPINFSEPYNGHLYHPGPINPNRKIFFKHLKKYGYLESLRYARKYHFDIGILGWWDGPNYGSKLVYYGLYKKLEQLGYSLIMIWPPHVPNFSFSDFAKSNYRISQYRTIPELIDLNQYIDSFIVGSDQYWNYNLDNYKHFRMLDFVGENKRKISYATSFGHDKLFFPPNKLEEAKYFLQKFDNISVREESAVKIAKDIFNVNAQQTIDPTFLLTIDDYNKLADKATRKYKENFILAYLLDPTEEKRDLLRLISKNKNLKVIVLVDIQGHEEKANFLKEFEVITNPIASIYDWIYQFKTCKFVFTDSFHGTCFSIIYNKPFVTYINKHRGGIRFKFFEKLKLGERLIESSNDFKISMLENINYNFANSFINIFREQSIVWLENAINSPTKTCISTWDMAYREISDLKFLLKKQSEEIENLKKKLSNYLK